MTTIDELHKMIAEVFQIRPEEIKDTLGPDDIEVWDSLGQLRLIAALEAHYKIMLEISEIFEIFTIGDIKRLLVKKGKMQ